MEQFKRTAMLIGQEGVDRLLKARVAVFGLGGVGAYAVEALARAGIGALTLVDNDDISESNINRQLPALHSTVGRQKTDVMRERVLDINPNCAVTVRQEFFCADTASSWDFAQYDFILDAIDTVSSKLLLAKLAYEAGTLCISCMGMGNKLDPTAIKVSDINKTSVCPLARVIRKELRQRGVPSLLCVWSDEDALTPADSGEELPEGCSRRSLPGSVSFVPSAAGLIMAGEVIRRIAGV